MLNLSVKRPEDITVLVVDDERDLCDVIAFDIRLAGYQALSAYNGNEAIELLKNQKVDIVLTDIRMPGCDGIRLLDSIKANNEMSPTVLFMSAFPDIALEEALHRGAETVFSKPFEPNGLLAILALTAMPKQLRWSSQSPNVNGNIRIERKFPSFAGAQTTGDLAIGRGGLFIASTEFFSAGLTVGFKFEFENDSFTELEGDGAVRWQRAVAAPGMPSGLGIEFSYLTDRCRENLLQWLEENPTRTYIPKH